jgi:hypothetical protein
MTSVEKVQQQVEEVKKTMAQNLESVSHLRAEQTGLGTTQQLLSRLLGQQPAATPAPAWRLARAAAYPRPPR